MFNSELYARFLIVAILQIYKKLGSHEKVNHGFRFKQSFSEV